MSKAKALLISLPFEEALEAFSWFKGIGSLLYVAGYVPHLCTGSSNGWPDHAMCVLRPGHTPSGFGP